MSETTTEQTWAQWREARDRDLRLFRNNPDRCWDCGLVEACRCGGQWRHLPSDDHY